MRAEALARNLQAEPEIAKAVTRQREKVMESRLFELYVYDGLDVTDEEIQAHYEKNLARFTIPEKRKVMQVIVADVEAANTMKARALAGEQFEELQKESRKTGGPELGGATGWLTKDKLHPGFEELFTAETGAIVGPVKSEVGFHVVKLVKIEPESQMPLAQLRETIRENVLFEKRADRTREWGDKLRREARIEVSKAGIKQYVKDHPEVAIEVPSGPDMGMGGTGGHGMGGHGLRTGGGTVGAVAPHGAPGPAAPATP
jgi:parvulin-like peptidyl-prolyl isomerase